MEYIAHIDLALGNINVATTVSKLSMTVSCIHSRLFIVYSMVRIRKSTCRCPSWVCSVWATCRVWLNISKCARGHQLLCYMYLQKLYSTHTCTCRCMPYMHIYSACTSTFIYVFCVSNLNHQPVVHVVVHRMAECVVEVWSQLTLLYTDISVLEYMYFTPL